MTTQQPQRLLSTLSPQQEEELIIQTLENHLRRLALGQSSTLPRWAVW